MERNVYRQTFKTMSYMTMTFEQWRKMLSASPSDSKRDDCDRVLPSTAVDGVPQHTTSGMAGS